MKAWARKLLCIDDDLSLLQAEQLVLESRGYEVVAAASPYEGLELFASQPFDAVLLDYEMPEMDGGRVAAEMKRTKPGVPILMHSGQPFAPSGCAHLLDAFVTKGTPYPVITGKIEELCSVREPLREAAHRGAAHV